MKFITEDWKYKVVAIVLAIMLWYIVQGRDNPNTNQKFIIPVEVRNQKAGKNVDLSIKQVTVTVNDKKVVVDNLTEDDIKAYIDVASILEADSFEETRKEDHVYDADINIEVYSKYTFRVNYTATPTKATVTVSDFSSKSMFIDVEYESMPPVGYAYRITDMPIKSAMVTGSDLNVDRVAKMSALISNIDSKGFSGAAQVLAFDANGNDIRDVKIEPNIIELKVICEPQKIEKKVLISPNFANKLPPLLKIKDIQISPSEMTILGMSSDLANIYTVNTEPIDLGQFSVNKEVEANIILPTGFESNVKKVKVKLTLEKTEG